MKIFRIFSVVLLCFTVGIFSLSAAPAKNNNSKKTAPPKNSNNGKKPAPKKNIGKKNSIENRLEKTIFPSVVFIRVPLDQAIEMLSQRSSQLHPSGKSVRITIVKGKRPEKGRAKIAPMPDINLSKKNVSLKQILDEISKTAKFKYEIKKGHVEFIRPYVARDKGKNRGKDKGKSKNNKAKGKK